MTETSERKKWPLILDGEAIDVYQPTDGQVVALMRCVKTLQADLPIPAIIEAATLADDIIMSLVVAEQGWKDKLQHKVAMGEVTLEKLLTQIFEAYNEAPDPVVTAVTPVKRRPGRPRKSV